MTFYNSKSGRLSREKVKIIHFCCLVILSSTISGSNGQLSAFSGQLSARKDKQETA
jgi:hypothetical protein